jgi:hypothetical protein
MHRLRRIRILAARNWKILLRAGIVVLVFRIGLSLLRYRKISRWIPPVAAKSVSDEELTVIMWSVHHAARVIPRATCLTQALAAQYLSARAGRATSIRIGVAPEAGRRLRAHAWLVDGNRVLIGGHTEQLSDFTPMVDLSRP